MIEVDALVFLLLVELAVLLAAAVVFLAVRDRKSSALYQAASGDLKNSHAAEEALRQQLVEALARSAQGGKKPTGAEAPAAELQALKEQIAALETEIAERKKRMGELEGKFADLEKEYMVLYQQQQQAKEINKGM